MAQDLKRRIFSFYAKGRDGVATGCEITTDEKEGGEGKYVRGEGRVGIRFFNTQVEKSRHIRVVLEPWEAFHAWVVINRVARSAEPVEKEILVHKCRSGDAEVVTHLKAEKWAHGEKSGFALKVFRSKEWSYNVPLPESQFLYAAEALKFLSTLQAYDIVPPRGGDGGEP